jgi:outer membrane protein assembly factor BamB
MPVVRRQEAIMKHIALVLVLTVGACGLEPDGSPQLDYSRRHTAMGKADGSVPVRRVHESVSLSRALGSEMTLQFRIRAEVQNIAYHKQVGVVYSVNGGAWQLVKGAWDRGEQWLIPLDVPGEDFRSLQYAIWYQVSGTTHWDNNSGRDYRVEATVVDGITSFVTPSPPVRGKTSGQAVVLYPTHTKSGTPSAFLRLTTSGWQSYEDLTTKSIVAGLPPTPSATGVTVGWLFEIGPYLPGTVAEMAPAVEQGGQRTWGTRYGQNLQLEVSCGADCLGEAADWSVDTGLTYGPILSRDGWTYVATESALEALAPWGAVTWTTPLPEPADRLHMAQGALLCGHESGVTAVEPSDGTVLFSYMSAPARPNQLLAAPARVYVRAGDTIVALAVDGSRAWTKSGYREARALPGGDVIVLAEGSSATGGISATVSRLAAKDGKELWALPLPAPAAPYTSNAILERLGPTSTIYVTRGDELSALTPTGTLLWQTQVEYRSTGQYSGELDFLSDGTIIYPGQRTAAVDPTSGAVLWTGTGGCCAFAPPTVGPQDNVYDIRGWKGRALEAFSGSTGALLWTSPGAGMVHDFALRASDAITTSMRYYDPENVGVLLQSVALADGTPTLTLRIGDHQDTVPTILGHHQDTVYLLREGVVYALTL